MIIILSHYRVGSAIQFSTDAQKMCAPHKKLIKSDEKSFFFSANTGITLSAALKKGDAIKINNKYQCTYCQIIKVEIHKTNIYAKCLLVWLLKMST